MKRENYTPPAKNHHVQEFKKHFNTFEPIAEELANAPWQVGEIFNDIDDRVDYWNGLITYVVDAHAPLRKKRVREMDVPYVTLEWKKGHQKEKETCPTVCKKQNH